MLSKVQNWLPSMHQKLLISAVPHPGNAAAITNEKTIRKDALMLKATRLMRAVYFFACVDLLCALNRTIDRGRTDGRGSIFETH